MSHGWSSGTQQGSNASLARCDVIAKSLGFVRTPRSASSWVVGPQRRKVTFGRDLEADFPVRNALVSRANAMIERRRQHVVLVDHSSNGSFVSFEGKPEIQVHHEELTLVGQGCIAFGQPRAEAAQVVNFRCA